MSRAISDNEGRAAVGRIVGGTLLLVLVILVGGWGISVLWGWFVAPVVGVRPITVAEGYGLAVFAALFKSRKDKEDESWWQKALLSIGGVLVLVAMGWIVRLFV